jgi:hypothetical protein
VSPDRLVILTKYRIHRVRFPGARLDPRRDPAEKEQIGFARAAYPGIGNVNAIALGRAGTAPVGNYAPKPDNTEAVADKIRTAIDTPASRKRHTDKSQLARISLSHIAWAAEGSPSVVSSLRTIPTQSRMQHSKSTVAARGIPASRQDAVLRPRPRPAQALFTAPRAPLTAEWPAAPATSVSPFESASEANQHVNASSSQIGSLPSRVEPRSD